MLNALGLARQLDEVDSAALSVLVCVLHLMIATRKKETDEKIHRVSACAFGTANAIISLHRLDRVPGKVDPLFTARADATARAPVRAASGARAARSD